MQLYEKAIKFRKLPHHNELSLPYYATEGSSGMDILAAVDNEVEIPKGCFVIIPTGLCAEIPAGTELQARSRSGLAAKHGVFVLNSPGTIDSDYRGEIKIILMNAGHSGFTVRRGDRIAQLVLACVEKANVIEADSLESSKRGTGGFGHSGIKGRKNKGRCCD
ncbi:MAG: dUTP diphosphatase [bacterium]